MADDGGQHVLSPYHAMACNPVITIDPLGLQGQTSPGNIRSEHMVSPVWPRIPGYENPQKKWEDQYKSYMEQMLDPGHPDRPLGHPESVSHNNYWDYTNGKRGNGGISGATPIINP